MNALKIYRQNQQIINFIAHKPNISIFKNQIKTLTYHNKYTIIDTREHEKEKLKLSKFKAFMKEFWFLIVEGSKETYKDCKWLTKTYINKKHNKFTGFELREEKRIITDFLKFVPFSSFLIIPGGELFLPLYLLFLPNSVPTWFIFDHNWDSKIEQLEIKQKQAHEELIHQLRDFLMDKGMSPEEFQDQNKYRTIFLRNKKDLDKKLAISQFNSCNLIKVAQFLGMDYMTGTFIISTSLRLILNSPKYIFNMISYIVGMDKRYQITQYNLKLNWGPFEYLKRGFLRYQINRHLHVLRKQDLGLYKHGMHDISGHQITDFARERGITTISCYETLKVFMQNDWVNLSLKLTNNQLIWYAMLQYDFLKHANQDFN